MEDRAQAARYQSIDHTDLVFGGRFCPVYRQRVDAPQAGESASAVVARIKAAARQNDVAAARKELNTLPPTDRTAAEPWIAKVDARDAALATARQFASEAMAALAKPAP